MFKTKLIITACMLILSILACGLPSLSSLPLGGSASTLEAAASQLPSLLTLTPGAGLLLPEATSTPLAPEEATATVGVAAAAPLGTLTVDQLQNGTYKLIGATDGRTVQLVDGAYQTGTDVSAPDYVSVRMGPLAAFGDLNGDGVSDAAVTLFENYGGTGTYASVAVVLSQNGAPLHVASYLIDDRPVINALFIQDGTIVMNGMIHGPNDPMCCAALPVSESYRLGADKLLLVGMTSQTPDAQERSITIVSPADGSTVSGAVTISGGVTIAPFENNLSYAVFGSGGPDPVSQGGLMVSASDPGGPGTFELPLDFASLGVTGPVRIEISDLSAADGSILSLDTIFLTVQ